MRRLFIGLVLAVALLAGLDFGVRMWAGVWVGDRVQDSLSLSSRPSVSFGGLLFTPQVVVGDIASAALESEDLEIGGVPFSSARLTFRHVTFEPGNLILHHRGKIEVRAGAGIFAMTSQDLGQALRAQGEDVSVRFSGDQVLLSGGELPQEISASASVEGGSLVMSSPAGVTFRLTLPPLGRDIDYGGVALAGDEALISVRVTRARLDEPVE